MFRPPILQRPPMEPLPSIDMAQTYYGEVWLRYPLGEPFVAMHIGLTFRATAELYGLANEINCRSVQRLDKRQAPSVSEAKRLYALLQRWFRSLPSVLTARCIALPKQLELQ